MRLVNTPVKIQTVVPSSFHSFRIWTKELFIVSIYYNIGNITVSLSQTALSPQPRRTER